MHDMTASNLRSAFAGESMARTRYLVWAEKAKLDDLENVARLFTAISHAEQVHAGNHFKALRKEAGAFLVAGGGGFGYADTAANLGGAWEGEDFEIREMYPTYLHIATQQKEAQAERSFHYALEAEKIHRDMYAAARATVESGKDINLGKVHVCSVCGHTVEGDQAPAKCPICNTTADRFVTFAA